MTCPRHPKDLFLAGLIERAEPMRFWPEWQRRACGLPVDPGPPIECTCPDDRSDAVIRFSLLELE